MNESIGNTIGKYLVTSIIGQGGMATVYKAFDKDLNRAVAVKLIRKDLYGPSVMDRLLKRFEREAKVLACLTHPNIVKILDYGKHHSSPFIVMEYINGQTLKSKLGAPIHYTQAAKLILPIAYALSYVHQKGVLHRDVKPSNILLDEFGHVWLTDFGIAKILVEENQEDTLTGTGIGVGTPEYMSPEQSLGKNVDARSDIYSLGIILFELITGTKPFKADTPMAVIMKQITSPPPDPILFVPDLPQPIRQFILKSIAKDPNNRFESMEVFYDQLSIIANGNLASIHLNNVPLQDKNWNAGHRRNVETLVTYDQLTPESQNTTSPRKWVGKNQQKIIVLSSLIALLLFIAGSVMIITLLSIDNHRIETFFSTNPITISSSLISTVQEPTDASGTTVPTDVIATKIPIQPKIELAPEVIQVSNINMVNQLHLWDMRGGFNPNIFWFPNESTFMSNNGSNELSNLDYSTGEVNNYYVPESGINLYGFIISEDQKYLVTVQHNKTFNNPGIQVRDFLTKNLLFEIPGTADSMETPVISPDNSLLAVVVDEEVQVWDLEKGEQIRTLFSDVPYGHSALNTFSPDGKSLAIGYTATGETLQWDTKTWSPKVSIQWHSGLSVIKYSPDSNLIATGSIHNQEPIRLWDAETGGLIVNFPKNNDGLTDLDFSPSGQILASVSKSGIIRFWNPMDGTLLSTIDTDAESLDLISFSPDGKYIVTQGNGPTQIWGISLPE